MIKLFTMVKNEKDILKDWIVYHGSLFGFENLYVIDNYSTDGTYEELLLFKNINIIRKRNYNKKGKYITQLIAEKCEIDDFAYPIDIDEFIVYYNKDNKNISVDKNEIISYFNSLPDRRVYKTNYIQTQITVINGYTRAAAEVEFGIYNDYGENAKSFIKKKLFNECIIDHGNHISCSDYYLTNLCLVHYHCRNIEQMKQKIYNNVSGLGYPVNDLSSLKNIINKNPSCIGNHHIKHQINVLENTYIFPFADYHESFIDLSLLKNRIIGGYF